MPRTKREAELGGLSVLTDGSYVHFPNSRQRDRRPRVN